MLDYIYTAIERRLVVGSESVPYIKGSILSYHKTYITAWNRVKQLEKALTGETYVTLEAGGEIVKENIYIVSTIRVEE